jgi:lipopolysaccharide transport system ATP-binding protein
VSNLAIHADSLGKLYHLGQRRPSYSLREVLTDGFLGMFRRDTRTAKADSADRRELWALKDVSLGIKQGDLVGIIGRNGAGKSTLLRILSRITEPTRGWVDIRGRVASLLEVGTGFHPELTGRENVFLNGAILGMKKAEIARKFDEMVAFAEVEQFIDTPVKRYSSGMVVRLAFAVAAHLEPEILLVDEVLAVGDTTFQRKCLGRMDDIAGQGRTVLFVSHNMGAVARLCHSGIVLERGKVEYMGSIDGAITRYTESSASADSDVRFEVQAEKKIQVLRMALLNATGVPSCELDRQQAFSVLVDFEVREAISGAHLGVMIDTMDGTPVSHSLDTDTNMGAPIHRPCGRYQSIVQFPGGLLNAGMYQIRVGAARLGGEVYDYREGLTFTLVDYGTFAAQGSNGQQRRGVLAIPLSYHTVELSEAASDARRGADMRQGAWR